MRVLLTSPGINCGVDTITKYLFGELNANGDEADLIYHWFGEDIRLLDGRTKEEKRFQNFEDFFKELISKRYDVIHAHNWTLEHQDELGGCRGLSQLKNTLDVPLVYTVHSVHVDDAIKDPNQNTYNPNFDHLDPQEQQEIINKLKVEDHFAPTQERIMHLADKITHLSNYQRELTKRIYPEFDWKSVIVPNGTDFDKYNNDPYVSRMAEELREVLAPKNERIILFAGRMVKEKGVTDLAEAFNKIMKKHNAILIYTGRIDGAVKNEILDIIEDNYKNNVFFTGYFPKIEDLAACYKAADVTVVPSLHEPFGLVALESICMQTPAIISNVDTHKENLVDRGLAYGVQPRNPDNIAGQIDYVLSHPEEARERTERAYETVKNEWTVPALVERFKNLYEGIINGDIISQEMLEIDRPGMVADPLIGEPEYGVNLPERGEIGIPDRLIDRPEYGVNAERQQTDRPGRGVDYINREIATCIAGLLEGILHEGLSYDFNLFNRRLDRINDIMSRGNYTPEMLNPNLRGAIGDVIGVMEGLLGYTA